MVEPTAQVVPSGEQESPEGKYNRVEKTPNQAALITDAHPLRGTFAKSLCKAHRLGTPQERSTCYDGVPCLKLSQCLQLADATLTFLEVRKAKKF